MKHVIVLHQHNVSSAFLDAQGLLDEHTGPVQDSSRPGGLESLVNGYDKRSQSRDGIQFYQFKQKYPRNHTGEFLGPEHLEYWSRAMAKPLQRRGEQIDAVVIPEPSGRLEYSRLKAWLQEIKTNWPNIKVLVVRPSKDSGYVDPAEYDQRIPQPHGGQEIVTASIIPAEVDEIILDGHNRQAGNRLRALLGMPSLREYGEAHPRSRE